jgi:hypothetical protein
MGAQLQKADTEYFLVLAEYRVLTAAQLALLFRCNEVALRKRLRKLNTAGFVEIVTRGGTAARGRPEQAYCLTEAALDYMRGTRILRHDLKGGGLRSISLGQIEHQLLINAVRIQCIQMHWLIPQITVRFWEAGSSDPPVTPEGRPLTVQERFISSDPEVAEVEYTPDGVIAMTHAEARKTILFFLEADTGTQSLISDSRSTADVRQKLMNYSSCLQQGVYRRYEDVLQAQLRGFRLLLATTNAARFSGLCRLTHKMGSCDFVWISWLQQLQEQGLWAPIWARGGDGGTPESILGTLMPTPCPAPAQVKCPLSFPRTTWQVVRSWLGL